MPDFTSEQISIAALLLAIIAFAYLWIGGVKQSRLKRERRHADWLKKKRQIEETEACTEAIELSDIDHMDGLDFEHYIAWLLKQNGFKTAEVTQASGDFGADVIASKGESRYAVQVKRYSSNISRSAVSDAVAAASHYKCNSSMVVTNSYFSKQATQFATSVGCELIDRDRLSQWISNCHDSPPARFKKKPLEVEQKSEINGPKPEAPTTQKTSTQEMPTSDSDTRDVYTQIKKRAEKEWPGDYEMQLHTIQEERNSYQQLQSIDMKSIPQQVVVTIIRDAAKEWPNEYGMQVHIIEEQRDAYLSIQKLTPRGVSEDVFQKIKQDAINEWPGEYTMQLHTIQEQTSAFTKLQKYTD